MSSSRFALLVSIVALPALAGGCKRSDTSSPAPSAESSAVASAGDPKPRPTAEAAAPCADANPVKNVYFGELHTHTSYSLDAYAAGARADPSAAFAFARGKPVRLSEGAPSPGPQVTIDRPLDFMAVTDHSEFLGAIGTCVVDESSGAYNAPYCQSLRKSGSTGAKVLTYGAIFGAALGDPNDPILCRGTDARSERCLEQARSLWTRTQAAANAAYEPCRFTTFKAYEWSGQATFANLHRNVIFSGNKVPDTPFDFIRYPTALDLWQALSRECRLEEGCDAITIPHNSNASVGQMWDTADDPKARPFMRRYQVLVEFFQHKGSSECLPDDALGDPGCAFEVIPGSAVAKALGLPAGEGNTEKVAPGYLRNGLARGLALAAQKEPNPLEMGVIGSTDTHNATPGHVKESSWPGHVGATDDAPEERLASSEFNPGGVAAVWAEQNTRESIFAALKRRETYATSGPRIAVRFYEVSGPANDAEAKKLCDDPTFPKMLLDAGGVPMGGLFAATKNTKPYLFVHALKDEAPLQRVDMVKMTTDASGKAAVSVKSIAIPEASGSRACVFWADDAFDPARPTLYYARVLEEPTWRWSHYDCEKTPAADPEGCKDGGKLNVKVQERAWTSPIFMSLEPR